MGATCTACDYDFQDRLLTHCPRCGAPRPRGAGPVATDRALEAGAWRDLRRLCGWCGSLTHDLVRGTCARCGGLLPSVPERILAEVALPAPEAVRPPAAPRSLPRRYEARVRIWKNVEVMIGGVFLFIFCWTALFPIIGFFLLRHGLDRANRQIAALREGVAVEGTLTRVAEDRNKHINHEHPWRLEYRFEASDGTRTGSVESWDPMTRERRPGERVWVVFDPERKQVCSLWPPVR